MVNTMLIADLHLTGERSATVELFQRFLKDEASRSRRLYILGDLFDVWIGDDDRTEPIPQILKAMSDLASSGTELFLARGNRDFLIGDSFCRETGCALLPDATVVDLSGVATLLMHGDLLVTDDLDYQRERVNLRSDEFRHNFLSKPLSERVVKAAGMRQQSREAQSGLPHNSMEVNQQTVERYLRENGCRQLIHGHTHRPVTHDFKLDGRAAKRIVLAEWREDQGQYLIDHGDGLESCTFR